MGTASMSVGKNKKDANMQGKGKGQGFQQSPGWGNPNPGKGRAKAPRVPGTLRLFISQIFIDTELSLGSHGVDFMAPPLILRP